ncbi:MAG: ribonuclease P [Candidatus Diapherotrites archaeon]|uniref:Ribonuclease P protein component 4 n=1 Tax=Candidatus Iainarchaeum sp. TaxID=3101447 RepID=A0A8T3YPJ4_9ARCH|nr:ribonuclease P [Candidatus Diapherotrites archaeon]
MSSSNRFAAAKAGKKQAAWEEIRALFESAAAVFPSSPRLADRHVRKARRLAMKHKIRLPSSLQRRFCKHCYRFLVPSVNCRIRLVNGKVSCFCFGCRSYSRFPYRKGRNPATSSYRKL